MQQYRLAFVPQQLNTLVNIFRKPIRELFNEFEGKDYDEESDFDGDVKYHLGSTIKKTLKNNKQMCQGRCNCGSFIYRYF